MHFRGSMEMELRIVGWFVGLNTMSLIRLLQGELGMSLADAKALVDLMLFRSEFSEGALDETGATRLIRIPDPVVVPVPQGGDPLVVSAMLEEIGLVVDSR